MQNPLAWRAYDKGTVNLQPRELALYDSEEDTRAHHHWLDTASATRAASDGSFDSHTLVQ